MSRLKTPFAATCVALSLIAGSASADSHDHTVYVYDDGFFPEDLYVSWGDKVRYINKTGSGVDMVVPYWFNGVEMILHEYYFSAGAYKDTNVWLVGTHVVNSPNNGAFDGTITTGIAPRE